MNTILDNDETTIQPQHREESSAEQDCHRHAPEEFSGGAPDFNAFRIFNVTTSGTVSFSGITIANGDVFSQTDYVGAGIQNFNAGIVNVTDCTLRTNDAHRWFDQNGNVGPLAPGGGIANRAGGTINITSARLMTTAPTSEAGFTTAAPG
jgi:hypothetical protein